MIPANMAIDNAHRALEPLFCDCISQVQTQSRDLIHSSYLPPGNLLEEKLFVVEMELFDRSWVQKRRELLSSLRELFLKVIEVNFSGVIPSYSSSFEPFPAFLRF